MEAHLRLRRNHPPKRNAFQNSSTDEADFFFPRGCREGCVLGHQVNWLGASEGEEMVLALSERTIDALKRRAEGRAAQWQLRDSL